MTRFFIVVLLFLVSAAARAQEKVTLNGYVKDVENGEVLIGVSVYIPQLKAGTTTNAYGFYAITVPKGQYDVIYSFIGYTSQSVAVDMNANVTRSLEMGTDAQVMNEVEISDKRLDENVVGVQMSKNTINIAQVKKLPALFGEPDIIKSVQMMPGVISAGEGTSAFFVRGGSADQNLILIDEAPVYDPSHLFGLFSVFNADVIKDSELYKGGIPSRFGGRLSSILDVHTKDGNNKEFAGSAGIGTLASRLMIEGPIKKDVSSYIVSARRSYVDLFLKAANNDNSVYFFDINAKVNWKLNDHNRVYLSFYNGRDVFKFGNDFAFQWGNRTATLRWNHLFNERLFSNITVIGSNFDYKLEIKDPVNGFAWTSSLQELNIKADLSYAINTRNELTFGYHVGGKRFAPGLVSPNSEASNFSEIEMQHMYALDHALYIGNQQQISERISLDYGLRFSYFQNIGKGDVYQYEDPKNNNQVVRTDTTHYGSFENIKAFPNLEPRVGIRYSLAENQSIKVSYNRMVQNTHLISNATVPVPFNTWTPSNYYLKPQIADQVALGYFRNLKDNAYELSAEMYYKDIQNVTDFADNARIFFNRDLSTEYRQGKAWGYGAEFQLIKKQGKLQGMVSYTWSKAMRKVDDVNGGREFKANHDRRNVVNVQAVYDHNEKWTFGATFTYSTGRPTTMASGKYELGAYNPDVITVRNGQVLPDYHRLDLSATLNPRKNLNRKWKGQWIFSIYNAYNRQNPFTVYTRTKQDKDGNIIGDGTTKEARLIYLFPILPSVTYNIKF